VDGASSLVVTGLDSASQVRHILNGVGLEQILVVQVVEQNAQATLSIVNLGLE
jgi:hypothetical protein